MLTEGWPWGRPRRPREKSLLDLRCNRKEKVLFRGSSADESCGGERHLKNEEKKVLHEVAQKAEAKGTDRKEEQTVDLSKRWKEKVAFCQARIYKRRGKENCAAKRELMKRSSAVEQNWSRKTRRNSPMSDLGNKSEGLREERTTQREFLMSRGTRSSPQTTFGKKDTAARKRWLIQEIRQSP